jgi:release factor glutamine methyltransferase
VHRELTELLMRNGFVAAEEEAEELLARADGDRALLDALVARRLTGEPLAWITGTAPFCGLGIRVDPGVYVPRWQTEAIALRAVERLPENGTAVDLCTGSGAIARLLATRRPRARVVASDVDARAVACARANGVEAYGGDLFAPLPRELRFDVVVGVVPYVPTPDLPLLQRDTFTFETPLAYDGGRDGTDVLRRAIADSASVVRPGGALLLELGGDQAEAIAGDLARAGYVDVEVIADEEGDPRGIEATHRTIVHEAQAAAGRGRSSERS